jgi:crossover junction endodeoxyribonuclease RusA
MITSLHLPYPPSVNHYWGTSGKQRFIGKKGKEFRQAVAEVCLDLQLSTLDTRLSVHVAIWPPDNRKRDVDNILKPLLDAMEHAGVYENDSQIDELHIIRHHTLKGGACSVVLVPISQRNASLRMLPSETAQSLPEHPASEP